MDPGVLLTLSVARLISLKGVFVMAPREGGKEPTFVRTDQWLGRVPDVISPIEARAELVGRFLRAFAPATAEDWAWVGEHPDQSGGQEGKRADGILLASHLETEPGSSHPDPRLHLKIMAAGSRP